MLVELYRKPKPERTFSLFSFFSSASKKKEETANSPSPSILNIKKEEETKSLECVNIALSSFVPVPDTKPKSPFHKLKFQDFEDEIILKDEDSTDGVTSLAPSLCEEKNASEGEDEFDDFDDFDIDKVDLMFLSQQRWIERCLEAEKAGTCKKQEIQSSPKTSICPSTPVTPTTGKRKRTLATPTSDTKRRKFSNSSSQVTLSSFFGSRRTTLG